MHTILEQFETALHLIFPQDKIHAETDTLIWIQYYKRFAIFSIDKDLFYIIFVISSLYYCKYNCYDSEQI